jgi:hypothetical protein
MPTTASNKPTHDEWMGMLGVFSGDNDSLIRSIIEASMAGDALEICRIPNLSEELVKKANDKLVEFKYPWRIVGDKELWSQSDDLIIVHSYDHPTSTTC